MERETMNKRVLTFGEPMGLFIAEEEAPVEDVKHYTMSLAGAEFNVAVGLTRLGYQVGYLTKLGHDPFGKAIEAGMRHVGIDTSMTIYSEDHQTGFMLKSKTEKGDPDTFYFRKNSAASTISIQDVEKIDLSQWDALHASGILPATSDTAHEASRYLLKKAKAAGIPIFFDPNLRPALWKDQETMIAAINELCFLADYVLPGIKEGEILCGTRNPDEIADFYLSKGVKCVIVKVGADGAIAYQGGRKYAVPSYQHGPIVDTVGAGDGFAVGVESGLLEGLSLPEAVQRGNAIGTIQIMNVSDNEGLPTREQLMTFMKDTPLAVPEGVKA